MPFRTNQITIKHLIDVRPEPYEDWRSEAACKNEASFIKDFSHSEIQAHRISMQKNQRICIKCPVRLHCLYFAMDEKIPFYVFGGATPAQREEIMKILNLRRRYNCGLERSINK